MWVIVCCIWQTSLAAGFGNLTGLLNLSLILDEPIQSKIKSWKKGFCLLQAPMLCWVRPHHQLFWSNETQIIGTKNKKSQRYATSSPVAYSQPHLSAGARWRWNDFPLSYLFFLIWAFFPTIGQFFSTFSWFLPNFCLSRRHSAPLAPCWICHWSFP